MAQISSSKLFETKLSGFNSNSNNNINYDYNKIVQQKNLDIESDYQENDEVRSDLFIFPANKKLNINQPAFIHNIQTQEKQSSNFETKRSEIINDKNIIFEGTNENKQLYNHIPTCASSSKDIKDVKDNKINLNKEYLYKAKIKKISNILNKIVDSKTTKKKLK